MSDELPEGGLVNAQASELAAQEAGPPALVNASGIDVGPEQKLDQGIGR